MRRIYVDFNTTMTDDRERVYVSCRTQPELLSILQVGQRVVLFCEDMEAEAVLEYEADRDNFYGVVDWSTLVHYPIDEDAFRLDRKVVQTLPEEEGIPVVCFHESVPEWPDWARSESAYGGGKLPAPFFVTRYEGQDYAVHQGVNWQECAVDPVLSQRVVLYELEREPPEAERAWTWRRIFDDIPIMEGYHNIEMRLSAARRTLPLILGAI
ncbi:MAG: hypothetical protein ACJ789_20870 [Thermomicrobiales bacterium]